MYDFEASGFTEQHQKLTLIASVIDGLHKEVVDVINENTRILFRRLAVEFRATAAATGSISAQ